MWFKAADRRRISHQMPKLFYGLNRSLGSAIGAIALIALLSSAGALVMLSHLSAAADARSHAYRAIVQLDTFQAAMLNQETGLRGFVLNDDPASLQPYTDGKSALVKSVAELQPLMAGDNAALGRLATAEKAAQIWQSTVADPAISDMANPATRLAAVQLAGSAAARHLFNQFRGHLAAIDADQENQLSARKAETKNWLALVALALWTGTIVTLLICGLIGWAVHQRISRPLLQLVAAMRRLANRDLAAEIPGTAQRNEVGEMARALLVFKNSMVELDRTALLRVTADTLPALIGYIDARRRVGFLNGEFDRWFDLHARDVSEVYGQPLAEVFSTNPFPGADEALTAALEGEEARFERQLLRRDSELRDIDAVYRPHRAPDGTVLGVVTLLTDVTERKAIDRQLFQHARDLQRSNEELEQFAYVASHDLKAPLRGIENLVSWIEEDLEGSLTGDTRTNMDLLKNRVQRLENLLDDLLAYSRAGRREGVSEPVDTKALVEELAGLASPPEGFEILADSGLPVINTARAPLIQALQNLISNAIKHHDAPSRGRIWVEARALNGAMEFVVTDDGPGIAPEFRDRVFGMFQTLRPRDDVEGSGMGLAIVKKLVERHNGKIWLEAGADGRGLAVHFTWNDVPAEV